MKEKNRLYWQFAGSCFLLIFVFFTYVVKFYPQSQWLQRLDLWGQSLQQIITPQKTAFFQYLTQLGSGQNIFIFTIIVLCLLILFRQKIAALWFSFMMIIGPILGTSIIKQVVQRPRPQGIQLVHETTFSFPSGHTIAAICCYGTTLLIIHVLVKNRLLKAIMSLFFAFIIIGILMSRIYLGAHFLSDVIGGASFSLGILCLTYPIYRQKQFIYDFKGKRRK